VVVFRCSEGHLFKLSRLWRIYRFAVVRLGLPLYMRCRAGKHWALVRFAGDADLTEHDRQTLELQPSNYLGDVRSSFIAILNGAVVLTIAFVLQNWWIAGFGALLIAVWGAVLVHANRREAIEQREPGAEVESERRDAGRG
jgi:hypothetical protein